MEHYRLQSLHPFGLMVQATHSSCRFDEVPTDLIREWTSRHGLIVFRGFQKLEKSDFALHAQQLGEPQQWSFGSVNELKVDPDSKNYIFTPRAVPFHWDGAFAGRIPHYILFHCLEASEGGETLFCDSARLLQEASREDLYRWQGIRITYSTDKLAHYGGSFTQKLIGQHPVSGEPVLRYAEPVVDLNPVTLDLQGLPPEEQGAFLSDMEGRLRDPRYCYRHSWQEGDYLIADNHALLHGREAFEADQARHIRRINLLDRTPSLKRTVLNLLRVRRTEFLLAEIPLLALPILLCASGASAFGSGVFWLGLLAIYLLFNFGDLANVLADHRLDAVYKSHLSNAVYELGARNVRGQMWASAVGALGLSAWVAWQTGLWFLLPGVLLGLLLGWQYSQGPFHFKSRGLWQLLCLWAIIFVGPMIYAGSLVAGFPKGPVLLVIAAFGALQMGIILVNTAEDYSEDAEAGLRTVILALGLKRGISWAWWQVLISGLVLLGALGWIFWSREWVGGAVLGLGVLGVAWVYVLWGMGHLKRELGKLNLVKGEKLIKAHGALVPVWLTFIAGGSLLCGGLAYWASAP